MLEVENAKAFAIEVFNGISDGFPQHWKLIKADQGGDGVKGRG